VIYFGLGDTDEFAHEGRYDHYLNAANRVDQYLKELWETVQAMPEYRGTTTLIVSTDHGRGESKGGGWKHHGEKTEGSDRIWIGILGPDTPALGELKDHPPVSQSQIAGTIAALLGHGSNAFAPDTAPPIGSAIGSGDR
jgi:arylsulfatase A-like enzyme